MNEKQLLDRLKREADTVPLPETLSPEAIERMLLAAQKNQAAQSKNPTEPGFGTERSFFRCRFPTYERRQQHEKTHFFLPLRDALWKSRRRFCTRCHRAVAGKSDFLAERKPGGGTAQKTEKFLYSRKPKPAKPISRMQIPTLYETQTVKKQL